MLARVHAEQQCVVFARRIRGRREACDGLARLRRHSPRVTQTWHIGATQVAVALDIYHVLLVAVAHQIVDENLGTLLVANVSDINSRVIQVCLLILQLIHIKVHHGLRE